MNIMRLTQQFFFKITEKVYKINLCYSFNRSSGHHVTLGLGYARQGRRVSSMSSIDRWGPFHCQAGTLLMYLEVYKEHLFPPRRRLTLLHDSSKIRISSYT